MEFSFKTNIHQNKDWNLTTYPCLFHLMDCLRPTSIKTRIETKSTQSVDDNEQRFKTNIHQNKDWNFQH